MKKILIVAISALPLGCAAVGKPEFEAASGGKVDPATYKVAAARCNEQWRKRKATVDFLSAYYGSYYITDDDLRRDAEACMLRQGVRVTGYRQKDGRLTEYPHQPKWMDY